MFLVSLVFGDSAATPHAPQGRHCPPRLEAFASFCVRSRAQQRMTRLRRSALWSSAPAVRAVTSISSTQMVELRRDALRKAHRVVLRASTFELLLREPERG